MLGTLTLEEQPMTGEDDISDDEIKDLNLLFSIKGKPWFSTLIL